MYALYAVNARTCGRLTDCFRIRENKSCIRIHHNRGNANWFTSVESCEKAGGRLLWLYDTNITEFMETLDNLTRLECANCQYLWIGLVQSVSQDEKYFWKRTKNGKFEYTCKKGGSAYGGTFEGTDLPAEEATLSSCRFGSYVKNVFTFHVNGVLISRGYCLVGGKPLYPG